MAVDNTLKTRLPHYDLSGNTIDFLMKLPDGIDEAVERPGAYLRALAGRLLAQTEEGDWPLVVASPQLGRSPDAAFTARREFQYHSHEEIFFILRGANAFHLSPETVVEGVEGKIVLMPRFTPHSEIWRPRDGLYAHICATPRKFGLTFHLFGGEAELCLEQGSFLSAKLVRNTSVQTLEALAFELCRTPHPAAGGSERHLLQAFLSILATLREENQPEDSDPLLAACREQVRRMLSNANLTVALLADRCGCHPDTLSRVFHQRTGTTLRRYIVSERLLLARELLVTSSQPVSDICQLCGFADHAYFSRCFRELTGVSPRQFRADYLRQTERLKE